MPVENEKKYVLSVEHPDVLKKILSMKQGAKMLSLRQGYLDEHSRIREVVDFHTTRFFTYKNRVGGQTIEIEKEISKEDFNKLWTKVNKVIIKDRIIVPDGYLTWEVDFFKAVEDWRTFLVMAEVEMPEHLKSPGTLPEFITDHLVYEVPEDDKRFINAKMAAPKVIEKLVRDMKNGKF